MTITSFSDDMRQRGLTPGAGRSSSGRSRPARGSGASSTSRRRSPCSSVKRLRLADGEPMAIELLHVPGASFPGLTARDLEESSFYDLLREPLRRSRSSAARRPSSRRSPTRRSRSVLGVPLHSPALLFERVTRSATGEIVEFTSSTYRGDRYRLVSELGVGGRPAVPIGSRRARSTDRLAG